MTLAIVFAAYLLGMAGIGLYCSRFNKDLGDFVLGGRRLGPWVAAFSAQASDFSGWLLVGLPAAAYVSGFSMIWTCIGCTLGVMFNWMLLAPAMRHYSQKYNALTVPDFLEARFNDTTRIIRVMAVLTILIFYASYISQQFDAAGKVFSSAFAGRVPWGETETWTYYRQGLIIGMVVILGYTAMGGFMAVCWTDFVQAILMVSALVALPVIAIVKLGGFGAMWEALHAAGASDMLLAVDGGKVGASLFFGVILAGLTWGVGYPGQPHIVSRFMAIENPNKIPKSALISVVWSLFALYGSMFVGLAARAILDQELTGKDVEHAMPLLALQLLPPVLAGLILSAAVAAMMSTVDSQIIVAVAAVVRDGYEKLFGGHPSGRTAVWLSRAVVLGLGVGGVAMAWEKGDVFKGILDAWGGLAASLGPAIVLGCLWHGTSRAGVIVGMGTGSLLVQSWGMLMGFMGGSEALSGAVPHFESVKLLVCVGVNLMLVVLISLICPPADRSTA